MPDADEGPVGQQGKSITVKGLRAEKDLIVDMEPFFETYQAVPARTRVPRGIQVTKAIQEVKRHGKFRRF